MKIRKEYIMVRVLIIILLVGLFSCKPKTDKTHKLEHPNIVYILADDLGYGDLSCYGQQHFQTPNIDRLAQNGMRFTQHYAGSTVCSPSRSALLTGMHTGQTFVRGNQRMPEFGNFPMNDQSLTIAELLKDAGYVTGIFGKWGLGMNNTSGAPNKQGFDEFFGYASQTLAHNYYPFHLWHNNQKVVLEGNEGAGKGVYAPTLIHDQAISFIEANKDTSFFLFYSTPLPHAELDVPEEYIQKFRGKYLPEVSYKGAEPDHKQFKQGDYCSQDEAHAAFAGMVYLLDIQVGELVKKLSELGIADNTLVIFTSDNGPHREGGADPDYFDGNGVLRGYKRDLYEGGIRVPMLAFWPGKIEANTSSHHISAFWDVLPTFCELVGIETPPNVNGISFLPTLTGRDQKLHEHLYWEFHEQGGKQAVRMGKWKGVRLNMQNNPNAPIELYNLEIDIAEQNNVANEYPEIVSRISEIMAKEHTRSNEFSFAYELK
ncbi:MAG TPA: arylsulfatase [Prolixibacteraceae bacterium]|nr:arylsulfatase [Prolixibacteraceae bacterium]